MSREAKKKQKRNFLLLIGGLVFAAVLIAVLLPEDQPAHKTERKFLKNPLPTEDPDFSSEKVRLSHMELEADTFKEELKELKKQLLNLTEDNLLLERKNAKLEESTSSLHTKFSDLNEQTKKNERQKEVGVGESTSLSHEIQIWGGSHSLNLHNVATMIPAGTVVKCMVVSTACCGVGVSAASNPRVILLQPVANGHLPWKIRVALKGSRMIGSAVGDLASERVYVRVERLTKMVGKGGDFIGTSISGCVIGDDGAEGIRGIVVDRSGQIILRAGFAAFLNGVGQGVQSALNNQTIAKISKMGDTQSILNVDTFRNAGLEGVTSSLSKLSDYYIKRAEQLQPVIQITRNPVRYVDVLFLKDVKIGETNIRGQIEQERKARGGPEW